MQISVQSIQKYIYADQLFFSADQLINYVSVSGIPVAVAHGISESV